MMSSLDRLTLDDVCMTSPLDRFTLDVYLTSSLDLDRLEKSRHGLDESKRKLD